MKERPILFSAPMVRAILDGSKTQTRRIVKQSLERLGDGDWHAFDHKGINYRVNARHTTVAAWAHLLQFCPHGQPGDRLWVRETWQGPLFDSDDDFEAFSESPDDYKKPLYCEYAADGGPAPEFVTQDDELVQRWRPSIHMPRWASRISLEITGVRVERLNDISASDCVAEGCGAEEFWPESNARAQYERLWESINGPGSWAANPWVWVVEFKRVEVSRCQHCRTSPCSCFSGIFAQVKSGKLPANQAPKDIRRVSGMYSGSSGASEDFEAYKAGSEEAFSAVVEQKRSLEARRDQLQQAVQSQQAVIHKLNESIDGLLKAINSIVYHSRGRYFIGIKSDADVTAYVAAAITQAKPYG